MKKETTIKRPREMARSQYDRDPKYKSQFDKTGLIFRISEKLNDLDSMSVSVLLFMSDSIMGEYNTEIRINKYRLEKKTKAAKKTVKKAIELLIKQRYVVELNDTWYLNLDHLVAISEDRRTPVKTSSKASPPKDSNGKFMSNVEPISPYANYEPREKTGT